MKLILIAVFLILSCNKRPPEKNTRIRISTNDNMIKVIYPKGLK